MGPARSPRYQVYGRSGNLGLRAGGDAPRLHRRLRTCSNCGSSNPADARFCFHCGLPLADTCPSCGADLVPGARFCPSCGTPLSPPDDGPAERKLVTMLFADVTGSTGLGEHLDPEHLGDVLSAFFAASGGSSRRGRPRPRPDEYFPGPNGVDSARLIEGEPNPRTRGPLFVEVVTDTLTSVQR